MSRVLKTFVTLVVLTVWATVCAGQSGEPVTGDRAIALDKVADQFTERLHQSLDVAAVNDMFAPNVAALYRDYPGDFLPFDTPRMSKALLNQTDDSTLRHKLLADYNLHYWASLLRMSIAAAGSDPAKALPADFVKAARKSKYLKSFAGPASPITLTTPQELSEFLAEADQMGALLKRAVTPGLFSSAAYRSAADTLRAGSGGPQMLRDAMGQDVAYSVVRESMILVMIESNGQYKLIALAPVAR